MLTPRKKTPALKLPLVGGGTFDLDADPGAERGTLVVFFRGLHCPVCVKYLKEVDGIVPALAERGVTVVAASNDPQDRATEMAERVAPKHLRLAYGFPVAAARDWGLYVSTSNGRTSAGVVEPDHFSEPGLFMISPGRSLYFASVQTMPFLRPGLTGLPELLDFVIERNYPARGEFDGSLPDAA